MQLQTLDAVSAQRMAHASGSASNMATDLFHCGFGLNSSIQPLPIGRQSAGKTLFTAGSQDLSRSSRGTPPLGFGAVQNAVSEWGGVLTNNGDGSKLQTLAQQQQQL